MTDKKARSEWPKGDDRVIVTEMLTVSVSEHWEECYMLVTRFVQAKTHNINKDGREDIVQDIMFRIHKYLPDFHFQCRLRTWLYSILNSCIIDAYRRQKYEVNHIISLLTSQRDDDHPDSMLAMSDPGLPEEMVITHEELLNAWELLKEYIVHHAKSERNRTILYLVMYEGRKLEEAARQVGCSPAVASYVVRSARRYVRDHMKKPE